MGGLGNCITDKHRFIDLTGDVWPAMDIIRTLIRQKYIPDEKDKDNATLIDLPDSPPSSSGRRNLTMRELSSASSFRLYRYPLRIWVPNVLSSDGSLIYCGTALNMRIQSLRYTLMLGPNPLGLRSAKQCMKIRNDRGLFLKVHGPGVTRSWKSPRLRN